MKLWVPFFLFGIGTYLQAVELACVGANQVIESNILEMVKSQYSLVKFNQLSLDSLGTKLPENCDVIRFEYPKRIDLKGDVVIKFDSYKDGYFKKRSTKIFRLKGTATVLRTSRIMHSGDDLLPDDVYIDQISIDKITMKTMGVLNKTSMQFRNYVEKGQMLESWMIQKRPDLSKGDKVKAVIKKSIITLTLDAHLLENGYVGDSIRVLLSNNKVVLGTLHDKKTVVISSL
jgi:flagella basal body P-ring formation protein FlgA